MGPIVCFHSLDSDVDSGVTTHLALKPAHAGGLVGELGIRCSLGLEQLLLPRPQLVDLGCGVWLGRLKFYI